VTTFPALTPSSRVFTPGEYPATAFNGYSSAQNRVRHSNVFLASQLRLTFKAASEADMLTIWRHYAGTQGNYESFLLPDETFSGVSITNYLPSTYRWIYAGPGVVEDLPCGGHNISLTLESVPPPVASVIGVNFRIALSLAAGQAVGDVDMIGISEAIDLALVTGLALDSQNGLNESVDLALTTGQALNTLPGLHESIELVLDAGDAFGDVQVGGVAEAIELALATGPGSVASAPGIDEAIDLVLVGGAAEEESPAFDFLNPANIGQSIEGGFFAGLISHTADGNPTHALIVAPAATGATGTGYTLTTSLQWKTAQTTTTGTDSPFDGAANTAAMVTAGIADHPAAEFCVNLSIGGFADWYLPARWEMDVAYFHLKPTTANNNTSWGDNPYSVPRRDSKYTAGDPPQTSITAFQSTQSEAFVAGFHWSSTENDAVGAWGLFLTSGGQSVNFKANSRRVRAFRRVAL
jgi:hypothetical protein